MEHRMPNLVLPVVAAFVGLVGIVGSVIYYGSQTIALSPAAPVSSASVVTSVLPESVATSTANQIKNFDEADYQIATAEGKVILLYFTASWCPECDYARMRLSDAVALWPSDKVNVYLVNFYEQSASSTNPETKLAGELKVKAPDTKVILLNGKVVKESTEVWTLERYQEEIGSLIK